MRIRLHPVDITAIAEAVARRLAPQPPMPVSDLDRDVAAERLVFALYIYPNYRVDARGPLGCIMDALRAIAPEVAAEICESSPDEVHQRRWPDLEDA